MWKSKFIVDPAASESTIDQVFTEEYNKAFELYEEERFETCDALARNMLADPAIPSYHRMKSLILLAAVVNDWDEANECLVAAERLWHVTRRNNPVGEDQLLDEAMAEVRTQLENWSELLADKKASAAEFDLEQAVASGVTAQDADVEEVTARMENYNNVKIDTVRPATMVEGGWITTTSKEITTNDMEIDDPETAFWEEHNGMEDSIRQPSPTKTASKKVLARELLDTWEAKSEDLIEIIAGFDPEAAASMAMLNSKLISIAVTVLNKDIGEDQPSY